MPKIRGFKLENILKKSLMQFNVHLGFSKQWFNSPPFSTFEAMVPQCLNLKQLGSCFAF
jgi:hypothetical protein